MFSKAIGHMPTLHYLFHKEKICSFIYLQQHSHAGSFTFLKLKETERPETERPEFTYRLFSLTGIWIT